MRRSMLTVGLCCLLAPVAAAGDESQLEVIGFARNGAYFSFAEHGIEDGSGRAYANVFVLDNAKGTPVGGAPVMVRADSEEEPRAKVLKDATGKATRALARSNIDISGFEKSAAYTLKPGPERFEFTLRTLPLKISLQLASRKQLGRRCKILVEGSTYTLTLSDGRRTRRFEFSKARSSLGSPASACAKDFAMSDVFVQENTREKSAAIVVLVRAKVEAHSGPDGRYVPHAAIFRSPQ
jgi:predicted secreted protein